VPFSVVSVPLISLCLSVNTTVTLATFSPLRTRNGASVTSRSPTVTDFRIQARAVAGANQVRPADTPLIARPVDAGIRLRSELRLVGRRRGDSELRVVGRGRPPGGRDGADRRAGGE
jgi:hypothetical protein